MFKGKETTDPLEDKEKQEKKFTRELAEQEFGKYCNENNLDHDEEAMNEDDFNSFKPIKESFIKACRSGRVVVDGRDLIYTVSEFSPQGFAGVKITIKRPDGAAMLAMDGYKDTQSIHKLQAYVAAMSGKEIKFISKLDSSDWMFLRNIATLFLAG